MGKKVKKGRSPHKEKRVSAKVSKVVTSTVEFADDIVPEEVEKKPSVERGRSCPHFKKGFNLAAVTDKFGSAGAVRCEHCRESAGDRRGAKGKGKHGKKNADTKSETKAIWVCLECGHFACGGVGLPSNPQCHSLPHARQTHHPLAIQYDNPQLRWCFQCTTLIPIEKTGVDGDQKDVLSDVVKLIKGYSTNGAAANVEGVSFGSGSVKSDVVVYSSSAGLLGRGGYTVRGLINLGNTCFFNSVLQNLLAMDRLRSYFSNLDGGPLSNSLKKLYAETSPELASRNVINPKPFFSFICAKAPQFKGHQQQDSHELLCCLLDRLSIEELGLRKQVSASHVHSVSSSHNLSFVDAVFGGQVSSTVCCLECGHSSTVYEPFLDLSLPVPTKKPISRKDQQVCRGKKTKPPPRRLVRGQSKVKKDVNPSSNKKVPQAEATLECPRQVEPHAPVDEESTRLEVINPSASGQSSNQVESKIETDKTPVVSADESTWLDFLSPASGLDEGLDPQNAVEGTSKSLNDSSWLDCLDPASPSHDHEPAPQDSHNLSTIPFGNKDKILGKMRLLKELNPAHAAASINPWEDEAPLQVKDSEILFLPYKQETSTVEETRAEDEASPSVVREEEGLDFDYFGDSLNEPEVVSGSNTDYLDPASPSHDHESAPQDRHNLSTVPFGNKATILGKMRLLKELNPAHAAASINPWEDEAPLQVKDSEILFLPYKQETSTVEETRAEDEASPSVVREEGLDFDYFGELLNEPKVVSGSNTDYLDPAFPSHDHESVSQDRHNLSTVPFGNKAKILRKMGNLKELNTAHAAASINLWEDEAPLQAKDSEILFLPYKQETSTVEDTRAEDEASPSVVREEEALDFNYFGDMLNEPEVVSGSNTDSKLIDSNNQDNGKATTVFSESDHDEVDDSDSPVSIESCLFYFTKPELLSNEHGWHCEICSKVVKQQRHLAKKNQARISSQSDLNGMETSTNSNSHNSEEDASCPALMRNLNYGSIEIDGASNSSVDGLASQNGNIDATNHKVDCNGESSSDNKQTEWKSQIEAVPLELSSSNFFRSHSLTNDSHGVNETSAEGSTMDTQQIGPSLFSDGSESGKSEDEIDSQSSKVIRNATKRLLIDKAPPILTIHLKRFSQDTRGRLSKLNGHVDFQETFDLRPYMSPRSLGGEKYDYRLIGVVEHLGSIRGGHYIAYVRGGERVEGKYVWYHASDVYVREVTLEEVLRSEAYILFYELI